MADRMALGAESGVGSKLAQVGDMLQVELGSFRGESVQTAAAKSC